jgi:hypothetical protein
MGWSYPYTLGVLSRRKLAPLYCRAVLSHNQRIALDGMPAETVDAEAKDWRPSSWRVSRQRKAVKTAGMVKPKPTGAPPADTQPKTQSN